jgi:glucosamine-6-phosphate deaminase
MRVNVLENAEALGKAAAAFTAQVMKDAIAKQGRVRLVLSTGASQFETLEALAKQNLDWSKVEMFHLDEYVSLSDMHPASFRKYLKERFVDLVPIQQVHYVSGEGNILKNMEKLTIEIKKEPIDIALIGIGENAHIAFNDPPADFETNESYIVVNLDEKCKEQQVREGWFNTVDEVPKQAITMTVHQIMQSKCIVSCVPHKTKANAIRSFFENEVSSSVPATILKTHSDFTLFLDKQSTSETDERFILGEGKVS